jgi:hypothetical protein
MPDNTQHLDVRQSDQSAPNTSEAAQHDRRPDHDAPREVLEFMGWSEASGQGRARHWSRCSDRYPARAIGFDDAISLARGVASRRVSEGGAAP